MSKQSAAEAVLETVLQTALVAARKAKEDGRDEALFAYFDILDVGLGMAAADGIELNSELASVDPYELIGAKKAA